MPFTIISNFIIRGRDSLKQSSQWVEKYGYSILPLLTAFLLIFSFSAPQRGVLGWVCLLPLLFYFHKMDTAWQKCFWGGFAGGMVFFLHHYAYLALSVEFLFPRYFSILIVCIAAFYSALFWGLFSSAASFILRNKRILLPALALPSAWVLGEFLRALGFLGHTGGFLGYTQDHCLPLLQCIPLYGYWGLSFLMVFAQAQVFLFWRSYRENDWLDGIQQSSSRQRKNVLQGYNQRRSVQQENNRRGSDQQVNRQQEFNREKNTQQENKNTQQRNIWWGKKRNYCNLEGAASLLIFLALLGGGLCLPSLFPVETNEKALRIALVQGNIPQENILNSSLSLQNFQKYLALSRRAHDLYAPLDLIVWPETVFSAGLGKRHYSAAAEEIAALAAETDASILFGAVYEEQNKNAAANDHGPVFNSILLQKNGEDAWEEKRYDKIRLVPFSEYFPFPDLLQKILHLEISLGAYTPGKCAQTFSLDASDSRFGGIICFESYFAQPARSIVQKGSKHLFALTNDAWFLSSDGLTQHARVARFRALETGVGVTQVANTGYTVSYDPFGREVFSLPPLQEGFALLETKLPHRRTLYQLWGNYFLYPCLLLLIVACCPLFNNFFLKKKIPSPTSK